MSNIVKVFLRLMTDDAAVGIFNDTVKTNSRFLYDLASALDKQGRYADSLDVCELALCDAPRDPDILLLSIQNFSKMRDVERALERTIHVKNLGLTSESLSAETWALLNLATVVHGECLLAEDIERASRISDLLVELCPGVPLFLRAQIEVRRRLQYKHTAQLNQLVVDEFDKLNELVTQCQQQRDLEKELKYRLEILHHPLDAHRHSALRVQNIAFTLSRVLGVDIDHFDAERINLAKELLATMRAIPPFPLAETGYSDDFAACYERFLRLILGTLDLDTVFGPATPQLPFLPINFVSSTGAPMNISAVAARSRELGARAVFFSAASAEYFSRYTMNYVSSILRACDCNCLVLVCVCTLKERLPEIVAKLGLDDPRVIFCSDDIDPAAKEVNIFFSDKSEPATVPGPYFAVAALMRVDYLLEHLGLPVLVTGIDTMLQKGIVDLLEKFRDADVVLNKVGSHFMLGSQLVNNLVMTCPTKNGSMFIQFLKKYLGGHLAETNQPGFLDQLDLHMAKNHLLASGDSPVLGLFEEYDINNVMFSKTNYHHYRDRMRKYRFLNMFVGGGVSDPLTVDDVAEEPA